MENRVHLEIPEADMIVVQDAITALNNALTPLIVKLDANERRTLPKMGEGTEPFVEKAIDYAQTDPGFSPPYISVDNMKTDFQSVKTLNGIIRSLRQLIDGLEDTSMLAGSEAYVAALSYYNSVKLGVRMNMQGAETIYNDLRKRFS